MYIVWLFMLECLIFIALELYRLAYLAEWRCRQKMPNPLAEPEERNLWIYAGAVILAALAVLSAAIMEKV